MLTSALLQEGSDRWFQVLRAIHEQHDPIDDIADMKVIVIGVKAYAKYPLVPVAERR